MYNWLNFIDYLNSRLIHIQPLSGLARRGAHFPQVAPVAIHIQPLSGLSRVANYCVSTPIGVG
jgi:hypothetical protein